MKATRVGTRSLEPAVEFKRLRTDRGKVINKQANKKKSKIIKEI